MRIRQHHQTVRQEEAGPYCHAERSEASRHPSRETLRFAQGDNQANINPSIVGAGLAPALVLPAQIVNPRILSLGNPCANLFSMLFEVVPDRTTHPGPYIAIPLFRL